MKQNTIIEKVKFKNAEVSLVVYSSAKCPGINLNNSFLKFCDKLNIPIDIDLYPIYKHKYRYIEYPWNL